MTFHPVFNPDNEYLTLTPLLVSHHLLPPVPTALTAPLSSVPPDSQPIKFDSAAPPPAAAAFPSAPHYDPTHHDKLRAIVVGLFTTYPFLICKSLYSDATFDATMALYPPYDAATSFFHLTDDTQATTSLPSTTTA